jgi:hypothetical protein
VVFEDCDLDITASDWAARFSNQAGPLWIHDVHFGGAELTGGIQMQEPGATVVMRDVLFDTGPAPTVFDLRHIDNDDSQGAYALWLGDVNGPATGQRERRDPDLERAGRARDPESGPDLARLVAVAAAFQWRSRVGQRDRRPAAGWPLRARPAGGASGVDEGTSPGALAGEQPL